MPRPCAKLPKACWRWASKLRSWFGRMVGASSSLKDSIDWRRASHWVSRRSWVTWSKLDGTRFRPVVPAPAGTQQPRALKPGIEATSLTGGDCRRWRCGKLGLLPLPALALRYLHRFLKISRNNDLHQTAPCASPSAGNDQKSRVSPESATRNREMCRYGSAQAGG